METPDTFERERAELADRLRRLRAAAGMSGTAVAERLGWSQSKISKVETGRVTASRDDVRLLLDLYRAPKTQRRELEARAEQLNDRYRSLRMLRKRGLHRVQEDIRRDENSTAVVRTFQPSMVPGLLQTAEYARCVFSQPLSKAGVDVGAAVAARLRRQSILFDPQRDFSFVVTEAALRWRIGDSVTMAAQMDRLANLSTLANVRIGVIPWRARVPEVPKSGFTVRDEREVSVESFTTHRTLTDPRDIAFHLRLFDLFADCAVYDDEARGFLSDLAREHA
ncbi:helix-turn-helix domain-containing protein [Streptomonospora nanhaiensis]|uniref:Transcriptional regulator with XRE-family HTH domain n=1 Tax=Streptomonospora nanhaiensis TaxID=1323731 RepID=A0A853BM64_9ACTN|nr:helix-turn-helix transcriptional regulator [Streptomonospora nanhaiensis]MBV2365121.1 helix-turn-helix domain-containing protein [Streptomonospora nanhaiensis]MBX9388220.1 helix-turn-helix domain-containing protein [Streptomonospora nanhaiensis]NYI96669.1 transcriptional regulator with XRE-family HTH domain [Streptomonospora nanhaiensis]